MVVGCFKIEQIMNSEKIVHPTGCLILKCNIISNKKKQKTNSFSIGNGVRQEDVLSPTLFALYINDLVVELNSSNKSVKCNGIYVLFLTHL